MKQVSAVFALAGFVSTMALAAGAYAEDAAWSAEVVKVDGSASAAAIYTPLAKAAKPWRVCVLFPHMKDSIWLAVDYGITEEAKRLGITADIYQAGGYENLPKQLSQFDDCMAGGYDAIIAGAISEAGLARKFTEAKSNGVPVVAVLNPIAEAETAGKVFADNVIMGQQTGDYLASHMGGKPAKVVAFPGPAGSGWAEQFLTGFKNSIGKHSNVQLLEEKFGDSGVAVQLGLIQNALQAHPDMTVIWGTAATAEAAIGAVAEANRPDMLIMSSYENQAMLDLLKSGKTLGFATQFPVLQGRISVDMAVRALEQQSLMEFAMPKPVMVSADNIGTLDMSGVLAPPDFEAVYSVTAK
jgi:protein TorT